MKFIFKEDNNPGRDISEIKKFLNDRLFKKVRTLEISFNKLNLVDKDKDILQALAEMLTNLREINLYIDNTDILRDYLKVKEFFNGKNISFSVTLILKNQIIFDKREDLTAIKSLIDELKLTDMGVKCKCIFTPINCYYANDILDWLVQNELTGNQFVICQDSVFNNKFNAEQKLHLEQFFKKLMIDPQYKQVIEGSILYDVYDDFVGVKKRNILCKWKNNSINIDSDLNMKCCPANLTILDNSSKNDPFNFYRQSFLMRKDCKKCINKEYEIKSYVNKDKSLLGKIFKEITRAKAKRMLGYKTPKIQKNVFIPVKSWEKVLIVGWWGTETAGDKAILGELLNFINQNTNNKCKIVVSSYDDDVIRKTFKELNQPEPKIVNIKQCDNHKIIDSVDAVIIGGGPLMDIYEIRYIFSAFYAAMKKSKERVIFGCGISPNLKPLYKRLIKDICNLATRGFFRDEESYKRAVEFGIKSENFDYSCDPAIPFVRKWHKKNNQSLQVKNNIITTLIRENTQEYFENIPELDRTNSTLLEKLKNVLNTQISKGYKINLFAMHTLLWGVDDRIYNRKLYQLLLDNYNKVYLERAYLTLDQLLAEISKSKITIPCRYHGHLFSAALGIPFVSIDYTSKGGKVSSFIKSVSWQNKSFNWSNLESDRINDALQDLDDNYESYQKNLVESVDKIIHKYEKSLVKAFKLN